MEVAFPDLRPDDPDQRVDGQFHHVRLQFAILGGRTEEGVTNQRVDGGPFVLGHGQLAVVDQGEGHLQVEVFTAERVRVRIPEERPDFERRGRLVFGTDLSEEGFHPVGVPEQFFQKSPDAFVFGQLAEGLRPGPGGEPFGRVGAGDEQGLIGADGEERAPPEVFVSLALGVGLGREQRRLEPRLKFGEVFFPATIEEACVRVGEQRRESGGVAPGRWPEVIGRRIQGRWTAHLRAFGSGLTRAGTAVAAANLVDGGRRRCGGFKEVGQPATFLRWLRCGRGPGFGRHR